MSYCRSCCSVALANTANGAANESYKLAAGQVDSKTEPVDHETIVRHNHPGRLAIALAGLLSYDISLAGIQLPRWDGLKAALSRPYGNKRT